MTSAADLCATVGCNHRRDEHGERGPTGCWRVGCDCTGFTEPPTVAVTKISDTHCNVCGDALDTGLDRFGTHQCPSVAEHDDNLDLEAIRARAEAATEGPWEVDTNQPFTRDLVGIFVESKRKYAVKFDDHEPPKRPDAKFIAHARTDVPALLAALDAERAKNTEALALHRQGDDATLVPHCDECTRRAVNAGAHRVVEWPCKTARILGGKD